MPMREGLAEAAQLLAGGARHVRFSGAPGDVHGEMGARLEVRPPVGCARPAGPETAGVAPSARARLLQLCNIKAFLDWRGGTFEFNAFTMRDSVTMDGEYSAAIRRRDARTAA